MDGDHRQAQDAMERISFLNNQADWCVDMATKTASARLFQRYVELAASFQQQAADIEQQLGIVPLRRR